MADGFVAAFQTASGLTVDYKEDFNDNEEWFAKNKEPLSRKQDIGADLVVPTQFMAFRLKGLGWLNEISDTRVPNRKNLRPDLLNDTSDPGRKFTAPYMTGMVGPGLQQGRHGPRRSPRSTTCGIRSSRARSACSPTCRTASA